MTSSDEQSVQENQPVLKNEFEINYNGISIHSNINNSIKVMKKGNPTAQGITLLSYSEEDLQFTLNFTDEISLIFMVDKNESDATLTVFADVPKDITDLYVPYNFAHNMKIQKEESNRVVLEGKKYNWSLHSNDLSQNYIHFTYADNLAHYAVYDDTQKFTFDMITELAEAQDLTYTQTIASFTKNLQTAFKASLNDNSFTEQAVVAYIASMAQEGRFKQAVEEIPQDYKKSSSRTYLSAPYLNSLDSMNTKLESYISESGSAIKAAAANSTLDVFTTAQLGSLLCIYPDMVTVRTLLSHAATVTAEQCTLAQATGIILTYSQLINLNKEYADILAPAIDQCLQKVTESCSYDNEMLTISENDTFVSVVQAAETGLALLRYGYVTNNQTYEKAGRVIVNSYLKESSSFDLRTLSTIYPMIAWDNKFYPRIVLINSIGKDAIWAWTCANSITSKTDPTEGLTLTLDFPLEHTHYVIFKGIPAFEQIFIYNMAFRTDPRFETYNSSGYVYKADSKTLLLKSRHKSQIEDVRMSYTPVVRATPAPAPKPAEPTNETETTAIVVSETAEENQTTSDGPSTGSGTPNYSSGTPNSTDTITE